MVSSAELKRQLEISQKFEDNLSESNRQMESELLKLRTLCHKYEQELIELKFNFNTISNFKTLVPLYAPLLRMDSIPKEIKIGLILLLQRNLNLILSQEEIPGI